MKHLSEEMRVVKKLTWQSRSEQLLRESLSSQRSNLQTNEFLKPSPGVVLKAFLSVLGWKQYMLSNLEGTCTLPTLSWF